MSGRLKNKVALITGGAQGFGKGIASKFLAEGASVIITDINKANGEKTASELGVTFFEHDVGDHKRWEEVVTAVKDQIGKLNILVNNAGIGHMGNVEQTSVEDWDMVHKVDLDSVFYGCKYALPLMRESGMGSIVNISSISGIVAGHNFSAYNSAKAGVRHLTKSVALHCARTTDLVRCNSVHPVFAKTEILEALLSDTSSGMLEKLESQIPVRK